MQDELIEKASFLMKAQTEAYAQLESTTERLSNALITGEPVIIENLTREGETDLLCMRSRLAEIASILSEFAQMRVDQSEKVSLKTDIREQFEESAQGLLEVAQNFRDIAFKAANLALGGSSFATACIQTCGLPPTTYRAPVLKYIQGGAK